MSMVRRPFFDALTILSLAACLSCAPRVLGPEEWDRLNKLPPPPLQPSDGPAGSEYPHAEVGVISDQHSRQDGYTIFYPERPKPPSAGVVVFNHGLAQMNPQMYGGWIMHLVRKGNIVIYPSYQEDLTLSSEFNQNAAKGILDAIARLQQSGPVQPLLDRFAIMGHSYGATISANLTLKQKEYGLPEVKALLVAQGYDGLDMRLPSYAGIPSQTKLLIVVGEVDLLVGKAFGKRLMKQARVDPRFQNLITHYPDHGMREFITAGHDEPLSKCSESECPGFDNGKRTFLSVAGDLADKIDWVDYYCYWKLSQALLDCAFEGKNCQYAFGNTAEQRFMGQWGDGKAIRQLGVQER